ncbi:MAG: arginine repressor [Ignavibacteriales bacterium]|nr:arginine repressor [Ignavibacteriales bacterium]
MIKRLLATQPLGTQEDLCRALRKSGFRVTQATLSRDLRELGVVRINTPEGMRYVLHTEAEEERLKAMVGYEVERIESNEEMIVVKTLPGRAPGVAAIIDNLRHPLILGTIAGDNTIFITPVSVKKTAEVAKIIRSLMTERKRVA